MVDLVMILNVVACVFTIISNYENVEKTLKKAYAALKGEETPPSLILLSLFYPYLLY